MKKSFLILLMTILAAAFLPARADGSVTYDEVEVIGCDGSLNYTVPVNTSFNNSETAVVYLESELEDVKGHLITGLKYPGVASRVLSRNVKVWIIPIDDPSAFDASFTLSPSDEYLVYTGTLNVGGTQNTKETLLDIEFEAPYFYPGGDIVVFVQALGSQYTTGIKFYTTPTGNGVPYTLRRWSDSSVLDGWWSYLNARPATTMVVIGSGELTKAKLSATSIDFGTAFKAAEPPTKTVTLSNAGTVPLQLTGIDVPAGFSITPSVAATIGVGESISYVVSLDTNEVGLYSGDIVFNIADYDEPLSVAVSGEVELKYLDYVQVVPQSGDELSGNVPMSPWYYICESAVLYRESDLQDVLGCQIDHLQYPGIECGVDLFFNTQIYIIPIDDPADFNDSYTKSPPTECGVFNGRLNLGKKEGLEGIVLDIPLQRAVQYTGGNFVIFMHAEGTAYGTVRFNANTEESETPLALYRHSTGQYNNLSTKAWVPLNTRPQTIMPVVKAGDHSAATIDAKIVNFGSAEMGAEAPVKTVAIRNTGNLPLDVTSIDLPEGFSISPAAPVTIGLRENKEFAISLNTNVGGQFAGDVVFTIAGLDAPLTVAVKGDVEDTSLPWYTEQTMIGEYQQYHHTDYVPVYCASYHSVSATIYRESMLTEILCTRITELQYKGYGSAINSHIKAWIMPIDDEAEFNNQMDFVPDDEYLVYDHDTTVGCADGSPYTLSLPLDKEYRYAGGSILIYVWSSSDEFNYDISFEYGEIEGVISSYFAYSSTEIDQSSTASWNALTFYPLLYVTVKRYGELIIPVLSETSINLGLTESAGESPVKSVSITNDGNVPLEITAIDVPDGFIISPEAPLSIPVGDEQAFAVSMDVNNIGEHAGNIVFTITGADAPLSVAVTGEVEDSSIPTYTEDVQIGEPTDQLSYLPIYTYCSNSESIVLYDESDLQDIVGSRITTLEYRGARTYETLSIDEEITVWIIPIADASEFNYSFTTTPEDKYKVYHGLVTVGYNEENPDANLSIQLDSPYKYNGGMIVIYVKATSDHYISGITFNGQESQATKAFWRASDYPLTPGPSWSGSIYYPTTYLNVKKYGAQIVPELSETEFDFGIVYTDEAAPEKTVTITNHGNVDLDIASIDVPVGFSISPDAPLSIAVGAAQEFVISMDIDMPGDYSGNIVFSIADSDVELSVAVSGTVVMPVTPAPQPGSNGGIIASIEPQANGSVDVTLEWNAPEIDDITLVEYYNIYVNDVQKISVGRILNTYTLNYEGPAHPIFGITAQYTWGESDMITQMAEWTGIFDAAAYQPTVKAIPGGIKVTAPDNCRVVVTDALGRVYIDTTLCGTDTYPLPVGAYIVILDNRSYKFIVR